jgi:gliding motility-associated-like protein
VPNSNDVMLGAGTYTVTVTDAMGCSTQATVDVSSPPPIVIDSFVSTDTLNCHGDTDGIIRTKASGGTGYLTYTLLPGNIPSSVADSGVFTGLTAGTYTLHIDDINNCFIDTTVTIAEPAAFVIQSIDIDSLLCSGDADGIITVTAQGGKLPYTYWITPGTAINNDGVFDNLIQDNYVVRITDASTCGDTLVTDTIRMDAPSPLLIDSVTVDPILCNGGSASINLHGSGGTQPYEGSLDGGTIFSAGLSFSDLPAGNYTPAVRDNNSCIVIYPSTISIINPPVITIDSLSLTDVAGCYGDTTGSLYVEASGGWNQIEYSLDGTLYQSSGLFEPIAGGAKTLYVRDSLGCTLIIDTLEVGQPSRLVVSIAVTHVIGSNPGTITLTASGGTPPYIYSIDDGVNTQDTGYFDNLVPGLYYAFVQDANGCAFDDTVRIIINELNISITKNDVSCYGFGDGGFTIIALDGKSPYWMTGSFLSPDTLTSSGLFPFIGIAAGSYDFIIGDAEGRTYADTIEIVEPDRINISGVITRPTCTTGTNDGAVLLNVTGGSGGFSYLWSDGSTSKDLQGISEGLFSVSVTDANDCQASADYEVVALHSLVADIGNDTTVCLGETLNITGNVTDYESVNWEVAVAGAYTNYTDPGLSLIITATTVVTYTVQKDGCTATDAIIIRHHPVYGINIVDPTNTFVFDTTLYLIAGQQASLEARADSAYFDEYSWSPAVGISDPASPSVICMPENTTVYIVTGTTAEGCLETDTLKVVIAQMIQEIFSGFTPNGDGFNDKWVIPHAIEYGQKIEVQVFNRWGEKIFQSKGYGGSNEWDGTYKGKPLPIGTYYYIITVDDGKTDPFTGTVTIIR